MTSNWFVITTSVSATICLVFSFILVALPNERKANHGFLLAYLLSIGTIQLISLMSSPEQLLHKFLQPLLYLLGPCLYFYVRQNSHHTNLNAKALLLNIVPSLMLLSMILLEAIGLVTESVTNRQNHLDIISLYVFHELFYVVACLYVINSFNKLTAEKKMPQQQVRMQWLKRFCLLDMLILVSEIVIYVVALFYDLSWLNIRVLLTLVLVVMLALVCFYMLKHPLIVFDQEDTPKVEKYRHSGLSQEISNYYKGKLKQLMTEQQLFLNAELTLGTLATEVSMTPHNLSQLLNQSFGVSFYDYINRMRIEYAKNVLVSTELSIIDIAVESGFNSKAAFYNAFKKEVGLPPGQWRKSSNSS